MAAIIHYREEYVRPRRSEAREEGRCNSLPASAPKRRARLRNRQQRQLGRSSCAGSGIEWALGFSLRLNVRRDEIGDDVAGDIAVAGNGRDPRKVDHVGEVRQRAIDADRQPLRLRAEHARQIDDGAAL